MTLARRVDSLERGAGISAITKAEIDAVTTYVETKIAEIASRSTEYERAGMAEWWQCCRKMVATDPVMAKIFAGFLPSDLDL